MEIVPGVHLIKIPIPQSALEYINVYLVVGKDGCLLIDTGWNTPEAFSALRDGLREGGFGFKDITQIVVTHFHPDHYGLAGRLTQLSGAALALHGIEAKLIDVRYIDFKNLLEEMEELFRRNGVPRGELLTFAEAPLLVQPLVMPIMPQTMLSGGEKISVGSFNFEVLWTPGHSPGHICLYEPKRKFLFSGDHVLPHITPHVGLHPQSGENPLGDFIVSLKTLEKLEINFVFPGHGPAFSGLKQKVWEILHHHEQRKTAILKAIRDELKTAYQIATEIPWMLEFGGVSFGELSTFDKRLAVLETLAHLQLSVSEGKVDRIVENDIFLYWAGE